MRIMLDTNVLISMIFFPSDKTREFRNKICDGYQIVLCDYVLEELRLVTERKFPGKKEAIERFFMELPFELVHTPRDIAFVGYPSVRDQKDSPILATAIMEDVNVFITGDKDFLVLEIDNPKIVTMTEFLDIT
ncbi:MAG: putative toxin-antitoxin system toxin component, PIN family [Lachnospiraceae bacterium]|nr:putative toxin-antitoxin system toxin component, PIN family [Lachnospiraceae bacterium]